MQNFRWRCVDRKRKFFGSCGHNSNVCVVDLFHLDLFVCLIMDQNPTGYSRNVDDEQKAKAKHFHFGIKTLLSECTAHFEKTKQIIISLKYECCVPKVLIRLQITGNTFYK